MASPIASIILVLLLAFNVLFMEMMRWGVKPSILLLGAAVAALVGFCHGSLHE